MKKMITLGLLTALSSLTAMAAEKTDVPGFYPASELPSSDTDITPATFLADTFEAAANLGADPAYDNLYSIVSYDPKCTPDQVSLKLSWVSGGKINAYIPSNFDNNFKGKFKSPQDTVSGKINAMSTVIFYHRDISWVFQKPETQVTLVFEASGCDLNGKKLEAKINPTPFSQAYKFVLFTP